MNEPLIPQKFPFVQDTQAGTHFWCACGRSKSQPFCDGSHKGTGLEPHRFVADSSGTFNLCGCKGTDDRPYCDGTHNML